MEKQPQTWKDILQKNNASPEKGLDGHDWQPIGQKGGTVTPIRTYSGKRGTSIRRSTIAGVYRTPKTVFYKCKHCNITGKKTIGEDPAVIVDNKKYQLLTCDEVIIKDVIE